MFEIIDFFEFLKHPQYNADERKDTNVFKTAFNVFLIIFIVFTLINGLIQFVLGLFFPLPEDKLDELFQSMEIGRWGIFVLIVFVIPTVEESIFRLPLVFKIEYVSIILAIIFGIGIHFLVPYLPGFVVLLLLLLIFSWTIPKYEKWIFDIWVRYFQYVVWFSSMSFGLLHIGNFELVKISQYLIVPLLVLPQLGTGFVLSYVRVTYKNGFLIGLLVHMFINFVPAALFALQATTKL